MRFRYVLMTAVIALCACGGGGSSSHVVPNANSPTLTLPASNGMWSASLGPWNASNSGKLNAFAIDPHNSSTMYVAGGIGTDDGVTTDTGIYKTANGGASWTAMNAGLADTTVNWLLFDVSGNALYASTETGGVFRSTDGAQNWQQVSNAQSVRQIVESNGNFFAASASGVLSSSDGSTWRVFASTQAAANAIAVSGNDIYAGLVDGSVLHITSKTQHRLTDFPALDAPPAVHAIAVDPADGRSIYATVAGMVNGIYSDALMHSSNAGASWQAIVVPESLRGAQAIAFSRTISHRLYVAGTGLGYTDDAKTLNVESGYGDARTLTVLDGDRLAIASDQGVALGTIGGSFTSVTAGLPINIVRSVAVAGSTVLVTMQDFPPARSMDGGTTWQTLSLNSTENGTAYINPNRSNLCYVLDNGINVSSDGCSTFAAQGIGTHIASTEPFATDPSSAATYVITENGAFVASDGVHFQSSGWNVPQPVDVAVDPRNGKNIYVSSMSGGAAVWHSRDGGKTFARSNTFVPPGESYPNDAPVIAVDPSNGVVVALTETAIYRSNDGGVTFAAAQQLQSEVRERSSMLARRMDPDAREREVQTGGYNLGEHAQFVSSGSGSLLVLTTWDGFYASTDDGTTLHSLRANAVSHDFEGFTTDGNGKFCTGTDGEGVICASLSGLTAQL